MQRIVSRWAVACTRGAFVGGNFVATVILPLMRFIAVVREIALVTSAREPCHLSREIVESVGDRDKTFADQIKIVVFKIPV
jgi:hypothetical protein